MKKTGRPPGPLGEKNSLRLEIDKLQKEKDRLIRLSTGYKKRLAAFHRQTRLLEIAHDSILIRDAQDRIIYWNPRAEINFGWSRREALGRSPHDLLQTKFPRPLEEINRELLQEGLWEGELEHTTRHGRQKIMDSRWVAELDRKGHLTAVLEINKDMTQRKTAEKDRREAEERFHKLFDLIPDGVFVSEGGVIRLVNPAAAKLLGAPRPEDLQGLSLFDLFHPDDHEKIMARNEMALREEHPLPLERRKILRLDGRSVDVEMAVTDFTLGETTGVIRVSRDISRRLEAEEALLRKDREISRHAQKVEKLNAALTVLLESRERELRQKEEDIRATLDKLVFPYLADLKVTPLQEDQQTYLDLIEANLSQIGSSFARRLDSWKERLTPTEIQVADLIRAGKRTKEIAALLKVSESAVTFHRANIRNKLGLTHKPTNLVSYLRLISSK
ncbi:MAG: PAS domain S-box protein [Thermodesulfobacteriota bacterium]